MNQILGSPKTISSDSSQSDARTKRISDARQFQRKTSGLTEPTLRLSLRATVEVWTKTVEDAREAVRSQNLERAEDLWTAALQCSANWQQRLFVSSHLGEVCYRQQKYSKAETFCLKALSLYEQNEQCVSRIDYATALSNTAFLYHAMNKFDRAESFYRQAINIRAEFTNMSDVQLVTLIDSYKRCIQQKKKFANPWSRSSQLD